MNIRIQYICILLFLFMIQGAFAQNKKIIGFLLDDFHSDRWKYDSTIFAKKVRTMGYEVIVKYCDSDTALQHKQAKELIQSGVSVLVVVPANSIAAASIVRTAHKTKIPVVAYDRLILNCDLDYYISFDGERIGELQAEEILKKINYKGNLMVMNGPESDMNSLLFRKGQMNKLSPYIQSGAVKVVYDKYLSEWTSLEAYMEANNFLSKYKGKLDGIIAANDELANSIIDALSVYNMEEKLPPISGQDATAVGIKNINDGNQAMTIYKPIDKLANQAAELACLLADKKTILLSDTIYNGSKNISFIKLEPIVLNSDNIKSYTNDSNLLISEEITR